MKTLQQELIDFAKWVKINFDFNTLSDINALVDTYLKSINSNSDCERRAIGSNEAKKECCPNCEVQGDAVHEINDKVWRCDHCDYLWTT